MSREKRWLRIPDGENAGLWEIKVMATPDFDNLTLSCPCCGATLAPGIDICQWGFFDDHYLTYAVCKPCGFAFEIEYSIATYELVSRRNQKRWGLLLTSRKVPAEPGKASRCPPHRWAKRHTFETGARHCVLCGAVEVK